MTVSRQGWSGTQTAGRPGEALPWGSPDRSALPAPASGARGGASLHTGGRCRLAFLERTPQAGPALSSVRGVGQRTAPLTEQPGPRPVPPFGTSCVGGALSIRGAHRECFQRRPRRAEQRMGFSLGGDSYSALLPTIDKHGQAPRKTFQERFALAPEGMYGP